MEFNDLKEALEGNAELQKGALELLKETEQGKTLLDNYADLYSSERINTNTRETYERIDSLLEAKGFEKGGKGRGQLKSFEALEQALNKIEEAKQKESNAEQQEQEEKATTSKYKKMYEEALKDKDAVLKAIQAKELEMAGQMEQYAKQELKRKLVLDMQVGAKGLEFNPVYHKKAIDNTLKVEMQELEQNAKVAENGAVTYYKPNGEPYLNSLFAPATAEHILKDKLAFMLLDKTAGGSADANPTEQADGNNSIINLPDVQISSRVELNKHAESLAKTRGISKAKQPQQFFELYRSLQKKHNYDSLT